MMDQHRLTEGHYPPKLTELAYSMELLFGKAEQNKVESVFAPGKFNSESEIVLFEVFVCCG